MRRYPGAKILEDKKQQAFFEVNTADEFKRMVMRHQLDLAKLMFDKDGGYSLRQFKEIFLKEMKENPDKYFIDKQKEPTVEYSYGKTNPTAWKHSPLNYDNYIQAPNFEKSKYDQLAKSVGLAPESDRSQIIKRVVKKAVDSGAFEKKLAS